MYADNVGGFVNLDFSSGSIGFFFLILQDGELPLISLLWRFIDIPLPPITQHSFKKGGVFMELSTCEDQGDNTSLQVPPSLVMEV